MDYQVVSNVLVWKRPEARAISVVVAEPDAAEMHATAEQLIAALRGSAAHLELYLYTHEQAVAWSGWFAHVTLTADGTLTIDTTNDPDLRRRVYEAFH